MAKETFYDGFLLIGLLFFVIQNGATETETSSTKTATTDGIPGTTNDTPGNSNLASNNSGNKTEGSENGATLSDKKMEENDIITTLPTTSQNSTNDPGSETSDKTNSTGTAATPSNTTTPAPIPASKATTSSTRTPAPIPESKATTSSKSTLAPIPAATTGKSAPKTSDDTWLIIIVVIAILIAIILIILVFCLLRNKNRRYSFDLYHKSPEDAGIPLSAVDGEGTMEQMSADTVKEEKAITNDTKPPTETAATDDAAQNGKNVTDPTVDTEKATPDSDASKQEKEPDQCSLDLSEISLLSPGDQKQSPKKAKDDDDDDSSASSGKTSQETLHDTQNENNNNSNILTVELVKDKAGKVLPRYPDSSPNFTVKTYWKNESKSDLTSSERRMMDHLPTTKEDMKIQNDDIVCIRIMPTTNTAEEKAFWSSDQADMTQDNTFTEIQLLHSE